MARNKLWTEENLLAQAAAGTGDNEDLAAQVLHGLVESPRPGLTVPEHTHGDEDVAVVTDLAPGRPQVRRKKVT